MESQSQQQGGNVHGSSQSQRIPGGSAQQFYSHVPMMMTTASQAHAQVQQQHQYQNYGNNHIVGFVGSNGIPVVPANGIQQQSAFLIQQHQIGTGTAGLQRTTYQQAIMINRIPDGPVIVNRVASAMRSSNQPQTIYMSSQPPIQFDPRHYQPQQNVTLLNCSQSQQAPPHISQSQPQHKVPIVRSQKPVQKMKKVDPSQGKAGGFQPARGVPVIVRNPQSIQHRQLCQPVPADNSTTPVTTPAYPPELYPLLQTIRTKFTSPANLVETGGPKISPNNMVQRRQIMYGNVQGASGPGVASPSTVKVQKGVMVMSVSSQAQQQPFKQLPGLNFNRASAEVDNALENNDRSAATSGSKKRKPAASRNKSADNSNSLMPPPPYPVAATGFNVGHGVTITTSNDNSGGKRRTTTGGCSDKKRKVEVVITKGENQLQRQHEAASNSADVNKTDTSNVGRAESNKPQLSQSALTELPASQINQSVIDKRSQTSEFKLDDGRVLSLDGWVSPTHYFIRKEFHLATQYMSMSFPNRTCYHITMDKTRSNILKGVYVFDITVYEKDNASDFPPVKLQITDDYPAEIPVFLDFQSIINSISNKTIRSQFEECVEAFKLKYRLLSDSQMRIHKLIAIWARSVYETFGMSQNLPPLTGRRRYRN